MRPRGRVERVDIASSISIGGNGTLRIPRCPFAHVGATSCDCHWARALYCWSKRVVPPRRAAGPFQRPRPRARSAPHHQRRNLPAAAPTTAPAAAPTQAPAAQPTQPASQGQAQRGGTLRAGLDVDADTLDPRLYKNTSGGRIKELAFNGLVAISPDYSPVPDLAEKWDNPDDKTWVFHLRPGVKFHDGSDLTANDVKYTYESVLDPSFNSPLRVVLSERRQGGGHRHQHRDLHAQGAICAVPVVHGPRRSCRRHPATKLRLRYKARRHRSIQGRYVEHW